MEKNRQPVSDNPPQLYKPAPNTSFGEGISTKTIIGPSTAAPRWSSIADRGDIVHALLRLGNGTQCVILCCFTFNRHFFFSILSKGRAAMFPAGELTNDVEVAEKFDIPLEDAANLSDFINTQLSGGMDDTELVGEYQRKFCS